METTELTVSDYLVPAYTANFQGLWDEIGAGNEIVETFELRAANNIKGKGGLADYHQRT